MNRLIEIIYYLIMMKRFFYSDIKQEMVNAIQLPTQLSKMECSTIENRLPNVAIINSNVKGVRKDGGCDESELYSSITGYSYEYYDQINKIPSGTTRFGLRMVIILILT